MNIRLAILLATGLFAASAAAVWLGYLDSRILGAAALALAATGLLGLWALTRKLRSLETGFAQMARTLDGVLRQLQTTTDRAAATIGEIEQSMSREVAALNTRLSLRPPAIQMPGAAGLAAPKAQDNVVALPRRASDEAVRRAIAAGETEISLQPVVSLSANSAAAFSVFACLSDGGDVRHLASAAPQAEFEEMLALSAIAARRRQMPGLAAQTPLHVPVSPALFASASSLAKITEVFRLQPGLAEEIWFEIPVGWFSDTSHAQARARLLALGVHFVASGWKDNIDCENLKRLGVGAMKFPASLLLSSGRRQSGPLATLDAAKAADIAVIAADVATDEDAVGLVDMGIDLMTGERFSGPRRLRRPPGQFRSA